MTLKLAIDGGAPVRESFLPFGRPCLGEEEIREVVNTLESRWIGTGPKAIQFEKSFAEYVHSRLVQENLRLLGVDYAQGYSVGMPAPLVEETLSP